jgi:hypothetical protein
MCAFQGRSLSLFPSLSPSLQLQVSLRLHHPLKEKEIAREEGRTLVVGPWSTGRYVPIEKGRKRGWKGRYGGRKGGEGPRRDCKAGKRGADDERRGEA